LLGYPYYANFEGSMEVSVSCLRLMVWVSIAKQAHEIF
jgi:hypothetical protein